MSILWCPILFFYFFSPIFGVPDVRPSYSWRCFPLLGLEVRVFGVDVLLLFFSLILGSPDVRPSYSCRDTLWVCLEMLSPPGTRTYSRVYGVDGGFPHSPGSSTLSTGSGHFLNTNVARLGSSGITMLDNCMGALSTTVRTKVSKP